MKVFPGNQTAIVDIELPLVVDNPGSELSWFLVAVLFSLVIIGLVRFRYSQYFLAIHRFKKLNRRLLTQQLDNYNAVFEIAEILRMRFGQHRLSKTMKLPAALENQRQRWCSFITVLDKARYTPPGQTPIAIQKILSETQYWIKRWK